MDIFTPNDILNLTDTQELLYAYTGPPPVAYGTRTKAVLENIKRPYDYYIKNKDNSIRLETKTGFRGLEEIDYSGPSSGFNRDYLIHYAEEFYKRNKYAFDKLTEWLDNILPNLKYSELAKGRQTYSFIQERNIPAANALDEMIEFLDQNLQHKVGQTMMSYLQAIYEVLEMEKTQYVYEVSYKGQVIEETDKDGFYFIKANKKKRVVKEFSQEELWDQARTLNTMWKHLERGRLNRRTIATPSMLVRGFVKVVEEAAKKSLEYIPSAGVPVGGEEKLAKLASKLMFDKSESTGELSGDQEKFNECLDPDAMRLMWTVFLTKMKRPDWEIELFNFPFLVFKGKLANMGEGLTYTKGKNVERFKLGVYPSEFDSLIPLIKGNSIACTLGMFMGMFNLSATLLALISSDYYKINGSHVESSDDFIHFFYCNTTEEVLENARDLQTRFKHVGVNPSPSKCVLIIPAGIGEFNSKYHYKEFVGNIATELPSLVPGGNNPMSDLCMGLNIIKNSINTMQMTFPTANLALKLFFQAYKYTYMVAGITRRTKFMVDAEIKPLVLYQGAEPIHSVSTIHLEELSFRYNRGLINEEELGRILNIDNPVTSGEKEFTTIRPESKMPTEIEDPSLGSIFKYQLSRNRTVVQSVSMANIEQEQKYKELVDFVTSIFPEFFVYSPYVPGSVEEACSERIKMLINSSDLPVVCKNELFELLAKL